MHGPAAIISMVTHYLAVNAISEWHKILFMATEEAQKSTVNGRSSGSRALMEITFICALTFPFYIHARWLLDVGL